MKLEEKNKARKLRNDGLSIKTIAKNIGVSKSSVSLWVRDIELTTAQKEQLSENGLRREVIERRRTTRLIRANIRRLAIKNKAKQTIESLSHKELLLLGTALYWAEGGKTKLVRFSNTDPQMIKLMMRFFRIICKVPEGKFRGYIHIHPHLDNLRAENYWSKISGIPLSQFYKTYKKTNPSSQSKRDTAPYGTFDIYICNGELLLTILGWTEKIFDLSHQLDDTNTILLKINF